MKDLVRLLLPRNNLVDPFGPRGGKRSDERFHDALVDLWCLLNEYGILFRILRLVGDISERRALRYRSAYLTNVKFGCGEDDVDLHISNGREATEVPRVLVIGFVKRCFQIWKEKQRTMSLCPIFSTSWTI